MEAEPTYEHHFVTCDKTSDGSDVTFDLIEGEDGGVYWGYGHVDPKAFIAEVNSWLVHCGLGVGDLAEPDTKVDHLWAKANDEKGDFELVADHGNDTLKKAADVFPVTRVWL